MTTFFTTANNLTERRKAYKEKAFNALAKKVALDLTEGHTTREVGIDAVANIIALATPSSGKGHAEMVREAFGQLVDAQIEATETENA